MKRQREEKDVANGVVTDALAVVQVEERAPKKPRLKHISSKYVIEPLDREHDRRFAIHEPIGRILKQRKEDEEKDVASGVVPVALAVVQVEERAPKKPRLKRLSSKYVIEPLDRELCRRFAIHEPIGRILKRLDATAVLDALLRGDPVAKSVVPITAELKMTIHNVVLTTELYKRLHHHQLNTEDDDELSWNISELDLDVVDGPSAPSLLPLPTEGGKGLAGDDKKEEEKTRELYDIPLRRLNYYLRHYGSQLNQHRFTAVVLRNAELGAASLIFNSRMVSTGCARIELALCLMEDTLDKIRSVGYDDFDDPIPCLRNLVSNGRFPRRICINMMTVMFADRCRKVELFPGTMVFHPQTDRRVTLIFESGEICHSGARTIEEIHHDLALIYPMILACVWNRKRSKIDERCANILSLDLSKESNQASFDTLRRELTSVVGTEPV
jgi:TATA-box binding protein (TBP) (component of TFIID and TFIIIB)